MAAMEQMTKDMQSLTLENKSMKEKLNMVSGDIKFYDVAAGGVHVNTELLPEKLHPQVQSYRRSFLTPQSLWHYHVP